LSGCELTWDPEPTALKLLKGTKPSRINRNEPIPPDAVLDMPDWIDGVAAAEWRRIVPILQTVGSVKSTDLAPVVMYCEAYARYTVLAKLARGSAPTFARKHVHQDGSESTDYVKNPVYAQVRDAQDALIRLCRELGLTPSARTGIRVELHTDESATRLLTSLDGAR
jgi:P27 family predicted phage terminase small subunit